MRNNAVTRNLNTLIAHLLIRLRRVDGLTEVDTLNTVNAVFLVRTFLKHFLDVRGGVELARQLNQGALVGVCVA